MKKLLLIIAFSLLTQNVYADGDDVLIGSALGAIIGINIAQPYVYDHRPVYIQPMPVYSPYYTPPNYYHEPRYYRCDDEYREHRHHYRHYED